MDETGKEYTEARYGCPECGETDMDLLIWDEDEYGVECETCGTSYDLGDSDQAVVYAAGLVP